MNRNTIVVVILLILFAFVTVEARAETFATQANKGGGLIVLTTVKCSQRSGMVAYSTVPGASTMFGCWFFDENFVHVTYNDGDTRSYPKTGWTFAKPKADM